MELGSSNLPGTHLMKTLTALLLLATLLPGADRVVMNLEKSPYARVKNVPVSAVTMRQGFWQPRMKTNVERSIPTLLALLEEHGIVDNFRRLSGKNVPRRGPLFTDSDIYKWMEAAAFVLQTHDDATLRATFDKLTDEILAVQEPSGYLNTYWIEDRKDRRWKEMYTGHELYCLGHMLQAGIAYYRATGNRKLMDGGIKFVDYLLRDFGPGKQPLLAGHPEIELALIELYRTTGRKDFLDLAGYLLQGDGDRLQERGLVPAGGLHHRCVDIPGAQRGFLRNGREQPQERDPVVPAELVDEPDVAEECGKLVVHPRPDEIPGEAGQDICRYPGPAGPKFLKAGGCEPAEPVRRGDRVRVCNGAVPQPPGKCRMEEAGPVAVPPEERGEGAELPCGGPRVQPGGRGQDVFRHRALHDREAGKQRR
jgi:hypothetical protein